jgi:hypothetical protein
MSRVGSGSSSGSSHSTSSSHSTHSLHSQQQAPAHATHRATHPGARDSFESPKVAATAGDGKLGKLSKRYESNGHPGTVSRGKGDKGGVSYGSYQLATKPGTAKEFTHWLSQNHPNLAKSFAGLKPGTKQFGAAWKAVAARDPKGFEQIQHSFIKASHYDPQKLATEAKTGIKFDKRSQALRDVLWSTAVQHRTGTASIFKAALHGHDPAKLSDAQIINAVYAERGRTNAHGGLVHFGGSSSAVQQSVANRFHHEVKDALVELANP